ncbi:hypothetical protein HY384_01875 [Candidatus Daviesbacteria bacterium]|nr:hypothetical protein [Candidatus Daviesbacteria bacterium]
MQATILTNPFESTAVLDLLKGAILLILIFYAIFALMVIRQVDLMNKALITKVLPILKVFSLVHGSFAIGLIILAWIIL